MNNSKEIINSFKLPLIVLLIHFTAIPFGAYNKFFWFDMFMHFIGGFAVSSTAFQLIILAKKEKYLEKVNPLIESFFVISTVGLIAILWEFMEFFLDYILNLRSALNLRFQTGLEDTLLDLFLGLLGSFLFVLIKYRK